MIASDNTLWILSAIPGRIRLHVPGWTGSDAEQIENDLHRIAGVVNVRANPRTGNVLVHYDYRSTDESMFLDKLDEVRSLLTAKEDGPSLAPQTANHSLVKVGVRGLLGHAVVDSLWFGAGFLGKALGLPLAGLGPLHVLMDIGVWALAFQSGSRMPVTSPAGRMPSEPAADGAEGFRSEGRLMDGAKRSGSPQR